MIGANGVERIVEIELAGEDRDAFDKSVGAVQGSGRRLQEDRARSSVVDFVRLSTGSAGSLAQLCGIWYASYQG